MLTIDRHIHLCLHSFDNFRCSGCATLLLQAREVADQAQVVVQQSRQPGPRGALALQQTPASLSRLGRGKHAFAVHAQEVAEVRLDQLKVASRAEGMLYLL